jgi:hypothetical protein
MFTTAHSGSNVLSSIWRLNAYKHLRVSYVINILCILHVHVLATLVAILREEFL